MEQNEYEGHGGDRPTKVSAEALLSKPEVKYDMNPRDDYYLNMNDVEVAILAVGDLPHLYEDTKGKLYGERILPATLKLGNYLFIADYETYDYYDCLYDHHNDPKIISSMCEELPFYHCDGRVYYNSYIHYIRIDYIIEALEMCTYYKNTKEEASKMLKMIEMIINNYKEHDYGINRLLAQRISNQID